MNKNKLMLFFKKESVFIIACILAIISCFFVNPSYKYFDYINWETLIILFVMMVIVQILYVSGIFDLIVFKLLNKVQNTRKLVFILVFLCFFTSIIITNDVALITFVPFAILTLKKAKSEDLLVFTIVLQTIAANMGSMLLPIGSPHNIFMYSVSGISFVSFIALLLPYVIVSFVFLLLLMFTISSKEITVSVVDDLDGGIMDRNFDIKNFFKNVFSGVDYFLLLTFVAFFILIGNLQNIPLICEICEKIVVGNELFCGIILSQIISNVPAGVMLSGFSTNYEAIIIGINIGGLGTLIASMANLISYKIFVKEFSNLKMRYIGVFSLLNVVLLVILVFVYFLSS